MPTHVGPNISGEENLVFGYDLSDQKNSYIGEPTTNLATDTPTRDGWPGSYTLIDSSTKTFDFTTSSVEWGGNASWSTFYYNVSEYTGQYVTISAMVESFDESNGVFSFIWIGQTIDNHTYLGYSPEQDRNTKNTKTRERISWSGVIGTGGKVGILIWMNNGTGGPSGSVKVRFTNVQVELKSHPTSFVNGTRSATQGLLDLTVNSTINLSSVSFDSNSQITFDGTNDLISAGTHVSSQFGPTTTEFTIETLYKVPTTPIKNTAGSVLSRYRYNLNHVYNGNYITFDYVNKGYDDSGSYSATAISSVLNPTGQWNHVVVTYSRIGDSAFVKIFLNGSLTNSTTSTRLSMYPLSNLYFGHSDHLGGTYYDFEGNIDVVKIYNRSLSSLEVLNNYNNIKRKYGI